MAGWTRLKEETGTRPLFWWPHASSTDILDSMTLRVRKNSVLTKDSFWQAGKDVRIKNVCKDIIKVCNDVEMQPRSPLNKCLRCLGNNALLITPIFIESDTGTFFCNLHGKSVLNPRCKSRPQRIYCSSLHVSSGCPWSDAQQI